jgi:hypothetical protein
LGGQCSSTPPAAPSIDLQQQEKKRRKRACRNANCTFCNASPCGECKSCKHPERKNKCILRYLAFFCLL